MMPNENPYTSPKTESKQFRRSVSGFYWRIPFLLAASLVATVPFYGFYVHAARDSQETAIVIMLCWFVTWPFAIGSIALAVLRPPISDTVRVSATVLIMYLFVAGFIGWGGVGNAIGELLAG